MLGLLVYYGNFVLLLLFGNMLYFLRNYSYANLLSSFSKFVFSLLIFVSFSN